MHKPGIWKPFLFYVYSLVVIYALLAILGIGLAVMSMGMSPSDPDTGEAMFMGILVVGVTIPCMIGFAAGPFLPRKKWAWIYNLILIAMGMGSCWMPLSLYLMIKWVEPEVKDFYGA